MDGLGAFQPLATPAIFVASQSVPGEALVRNAYLVKRESGNVLIDPLAIDESRERDLELLGGVSLAAVLSADCMPNVGAYERRFGAKIAARFAHRGEVFPGGVAISVPNQRTREAFAIALSSERTVFAGDLLAGSPAGALSLPFGLHGETATQAALGLRAILQQNPKRVLVACGQSIYADAFATLYAALYARAGAEMHRINLDGLDSCDGDAEVGFAIGAAGLGYRVSTLAPGERFCPLHGHAREEELFFVIDGTPSVRMLGGTISCRKGDFIALPVGETGTHQLFNDSERPATVLLLARTETPEICYYPDSDKLLVDTDTFIRGDASRIVRASPDLDYFDGELP